MLFYPKQELAEQFICFTTSVHGGVSTGNYQSFNIAQHVGDNVHRVATNRELLASIIAQQSINATGQQQDIKPIAWMNQQHTALVAQYASLGTNKPVDACVTDQAFTPLAIMTADCLPIVLACAKSGKIAAVHAGWRGLMDNIIEHTLSHFCSLNSVYAWIGPAISQRNFEISESLVSRFKEYSSAVMQQDLKYYVDLKSIAVSKLQQREVSYIESSPLCSYQSSDCFSYRRSSHLGFAETGRMATIIMRCE